MSITIKRGQVWWANLDPARGTEPGKIRPVAVLQTDLLNSAGHPSTVICPLSTKVNRKASILRVYIEKGEAGNPEPCDILVDQIRAIDNTRFTSPIGVLPTAKLLKLEENVKVLLDF